MSAGSQDAHRVVQAARLACAGFALLWVLAGGTVRRQCPFGRGKRGHSCFLGERPPADHNVGDNINVPFSAFLLFFAST